jgi:RNA polymerase sigma factor for flagellar operon FliA
LGSDSPSAREQALVRRALPMVRRAAKRVSRDFYGRVKPRELYAVGTFALYRAAKKFTDDMSHDFADHAYRRVRDAMLAAVRVELFHERVRRAAIRSADDLCATYRDDAWNPAEHDEADARRGVRQFFDELLAATFTGAIEEARRVHEETPAEVDAEYKHAMDVLAAALQKLSDEELQIVALVFREGRTLEEAGEALGLSERTARRRRATALARLREELAAHGVERAPPCDTIP